MHHYILQFKDLLAPLFVPDSASKGISTIAGWMKKLSEGITMSHDYVICLATPGVRTVWLHDHLWAYGQWQPPGCCTVSWAKHQCLQPNELHSCGEREFSWDISSFLLAKLKHVANPRLSHLGLKCPVTNVPAPGGLSQGLLWDM